MNKLKQTGNALVRFLFQFVQPFNRGQLVFEFMNIFGVSVVVFR